MQAYFYLNYVKDINNDTNHLFDLKPFFKAFTNWETSIEIAKRLAKNDQKLFLTPVTGTKNFFLFISTKTNEAFQKVTANDKSIDTSELLKELQKNEGIGFASYILFDETRNLFVYGNRQGGPSVSVFKGYVNSILPQIGIGGFEFIMKPLVHSIEKTIATELPYMGETIITVDSINPLYQLLAKELFPTSDDAKDVKQIQIVLKPEPRQNIRTSVRSAMLKVKDQGLVSIEFNGKKDGELDLKQKPYKVGKEGNISETLDSFDTIYIYNEMQRYLEENVSVDKKYKAMINQLTFEGDLDNLIRFYEPSEWTNH